MTRFWHDLLSQGDERENCNVIRNANHRNHPEGDFECLHVRELRNFTAIIDGSPEHTLRFLVHPAKTERTDETHDTSGCGDKQHNSKHVRSRVELLHVLINRLHDKEVYGAADSRERKLKAEDHVQFLSFEPKHSVIILRYSQWFSPNSENEAPEQHDIKSVDRRAERKHQLTDHENEHVDDGAETNSKHPVNEKSTDKTENDIRPWIYRIQHRKLCRREVQIGFEIVLQCTGIIITKVWRCK